MTIGKKLAAAFATIIAFSLILGIVSAVNMKTIDTSYSDLITDNMVPVIDMGEVVADMEGVRVGMRELVIDAAFDDAAAAETHYKDIQDKMAKITENLDSYTALITSEEVRALFTEARGMYDNEYKPYIEENYQYAISGDEASARDLLTKSSPVMTQVLDSMNQCLAIDEENTLTQSDVNTATSNQIILMVVIMLAAAVIVSVVLAYKISTSISSPLKSMMVYLNHASSTGDILITEETKSLMSRISAKKDEIGGISTSLSAFIMHVIKNSEILRTIATNDLTTDISPLTDKDTLGVAMKTMSQGLNEVLGDIDVASTQVSTGASQVADGAQALAAGSTEQAASVEELSGSVAEIAERTKKNAELAEQAAALAASIKTSAEKGSRQMDEMMTAVRDINLSSQDIGKVIKVIDDIAFQTNILALNAAVEAARAGQHGKGFAVVAEEVRNLAAKSAEAAKDTESLIANSMQKAELGVRIAGETAGSLSEIVTGIGESNRLVTEIATASEAQALGISQINIGIDQVAQVVQQNSATAEQSAAASEEMSGQSTLLSQLIRQFKLRGSRPSQSGGFAPQAPDEAGFTLGGKY